MIPASVLDAFTDPVLCATTVPAGKRRVIFSLSSHAFRWPSISLHASGDSTFPASISSRSCTISRAVVVPRPYFFVAAGSMLVVLPLYTFALIFVFLRPSAAMRSFVVGMPIWSRTRLVAVLSEKTIMSRTASFSGNVAPSEKCAVSTPLPGTLSTFLSVSVVSNLTFPSFACQYASTMIGSLMRLAVGITSSAPM